MDEQLFTQAQVDLALRKEELILRVERGESLETVGQDLGLTYHSKHVSRLRRQYFEGGRHWISLVDRRERRPSPKITDEVAQWIEKEVSRDPDVTASYLRAQIQSVFEVEVTERHMRRVIRAMGHKGQGGRPPRTSWPVVAPGESPIIEQTPHAGIFFPPGCTVADGDYAGDDAGV